MEQVLVGREAEQKVLNKALTSNAPEMVAVVGRRRVGKTFLVRKTYKHQIIFEVTGSQNAPKAEQLANFTNQLNYFAQPIIPVKPPADWPTAFQMLIDYLEAKLGKEKIVVFLDELPWLATRKSGFLRAFSFFWNSWASQKNVVIVICGSAASWMIQKVVRNKGGLHNRITRRIHLAPFNLSDTELFLQSNGIKMNHYQILQIYMTMGGIPHYLKELESGKSAIQNIDDICFSETGLLQDEFSSLYEALFDNAAEHIKIIRLLAENRLGLTRQEIIKLGKASDGGNISKTLEELVSSGFCTLVFAFGNKKKDRRYILTDEYSLFYLKFIENKRNEGRGTWTKLSQTQTWKSWSGFAFENICFKHVFQIKESLRIGGIYSEASTYRFKGDDTIPDFQIDLLIDRNDQVINIIEIKFYKEDFLMTKAYAAKLRQRMALFKAKTKTKKQLFLTMLTTFPLIENQHSLGFVDQALTMEVLFKSVEV
ncbi:MAG: ATP-binding protein [Bacteroidota bacterium]